MIYHQFPYLKLPCGLSHFQTHPNIISWYLILYLLNHSIHGWNSHFQTHTHTMWGFQEIWGTLKSFILIWVWVFHYKPSSYWGTPIDGKSHVFWCRFSLELASKAGPPQWSQPARRLEHTGGDWQPGTSRRHRRSSIEIKIGWKQGDRNKWRNEHWEETCVSLCLIPFHENGMTWWVWEYWRWSRLEITFKFSLAELLEWSWSQSLGWLTISLIEDSCSRQTCAIFDDEWHAVEYGGGSTCKATWGPPRLK